MNKTKRLLGYTLLVAILLYIALEFFLTLGAPAYLKFRKTKLDQLSSLHHDLGLATIDTSVFYEHRGGANVGKLNRIFELEKEYKSIPDLQSKKDKIISDFDTTINNYKTATSEFKEIDNSFIPTDLSQLDFSVKRASDIYLLNLKKQFKANVIAYNQKHTNLYFEIDPVQEVKSMTIEDKVGQLFMFGTQGTTLNSTDRNFIRKYKLGGIVYLGENISNEAGVKSLSNAMQEVQGNYPIFISTDQEGGVVKRIWWDDTASEMEMKNFSKDQECSDYKARDKLLWSLGINWNLGIVADGTSNPYSFIFERTFGGDYKKVGEKVSTAVDCTAKTITTLKHFPGHGATTLDTHLGLAKVTKTKAEWEAQDLVPFKSGVDAHTDSIMLGQLVLNWLDNKNPATLSKKVHDYLRTNLKYNGVLITDDLRMLESAGYSRSNIVKMALENDNDVLLYSFNDTTRDAIMNQALNLVKSGTIKEEVIDQKLLRILELKNSIIKSQKRYIPKALIY